MNSWFSEVGGETEPGTLPIAGSSLASKLESFALVLMRLDHVADPYRKRRLLGFTDIWATRCALGVYELFTVKLQPV